MTHIGRHHDDSSALKDVLSLPYRHVPVNSPDNLFLEIKPPRHFAPADQLVRDQGFERIEDDDTTIWVTKHLVQGDCPEY